MSAMEKSCPEPETLARWLEAGLSAEERVRVTSHLAACDDCRRSVALASTLDAPPAATVNEVLLQRVVTASRRRRIPPLAVAAAAFIAVGIGLSLISLTKSEAPAPTLAVGLHNAPDASPAPVVAAKPAPAPVEPPRPQPAPPPRIEPPPVVVAAKETPRPATPPADPSPKETPVPDVKLESVAKGPDLAPAPEDNKAYVPVLVVDPVGDLWLRRDQVDAKVVAVERAARKDLLTARTAAASFSLEARASVMLEKGSEAAFSKVQSDDAYSLALGQGLVMLDTEGSSQKWRIAFGKNELDFSNFNGRLSVESRGDRMSAMLLDGSAELKIGALVKKAQVGQELVLTHEGQVVEQKGEAQKRMARFDELRPKLFMAFAATFDEKKDDLPLFPYTVTAGRLVPGPTGLFLQCEGPPPAKSGDRMTIAGEVRPERSFSVASGMVLRFRYRTTLPTFTAKLGKYSAEVTSRRAGQWTDVEVPLRDFSFEGTPLLPTDPVDGIRFTGTFDKRVGQLDIDGVQFLRRVR
ncbi:MAG TPA: zf-HC2 domain-containing protein [Planctomycetota bacterium]|nr:zf-HC2 domain-containing protein [Planctomycetota bacterium]